MTNVNDAVREFHSKLMSVVDVHAPLNKVKMRLNAPDWINSDYLAHVDEREHWSKKFDKCPCPYHHGLKWESIHRTKQLRDDLKANYFRESLLKCGNDSKKKWELIRK